VQRTLQIDEAVYRAAESEALSRGESVSEFIEHAVEERVQRSVESSPPKPNVDEWMEDFLRRVKSTRFGVGPHPTRDEMNER
jgi:hypothetical protein